MNTTCKTCGNSTVHEEDGGIICTSCGVLQCDAIVFDTRASNGQNVPQDKYNYHFYSSTLPCHIIQRNMESTPRCLIFGRKRITELCTALALNTEVRDQAKSIYERLCMHSDQPIQGKHFKKKCAFAAACVFIVCRNLDLPVTMDYLAIAQTANASDCYACAKEISKILGIPIQSQSIENIVNVVLEKDLIPEIAVTSDSRRLTQEILQLSTDLFVSQGRKPQLLILGAFFLAYKAEDFCHRRTIALDKVVKHNRSVRKCLILLQQTLFELLKSIPWVEQKDINTQMIPYYLKDIVKYKKVLIREAIRKGDEEEVLAEPDSNNQNTEHVPCEEVVDKTKSIKRRVSLSQPVETLLQENTLFYPPAYKKAKRRAQDQAFLDEQIEIGKEMLDKLVSELST